MEALLSCQELVKRYGAKVALDGVTLTVQPGRIIGLLGPNGSGKTTLIKLISGLLTPTSGQITVNGHAPGVETKSMVSYLPERSYLSDWMRVSDALAFFADFYPDFDMARAEDMLRRLNIAPSEHIKSLSKGTKEKVQLILVMSRQAKLYLLDEPIGGVDPAARDYILNTIINNYSPESSVILSTHLISDIEQVLDEVIMIQAGQVVMTATVDEIRQERGMSVDALFREVFKC